MASEGNAQFFDAHALLDREEDVIKEIETSKPLKIGVQNMCVLPVLENGPIAPARERNYHIHEVDHIMNWRIYLDI